jgi:hypothetical protein
MSACGGLDHADICLHIIKDTCCLRQNYPKSLNTSLELSRKPTFQVVSKGVIGDYINKKFLRNELECVVSLESIFYVDSFCRTHQIYMPCI